MTGARGRSDGMGGVSRRELLKRGAAAGAAGAWLTPAVQVIGMGRASAQLASQPNALSTSTTTSSTTTTTVPVATPATVPATTQAPSATTAPTTSSTTSTTVPVTVPPPSQVDLVLTNSTGDKFGARFTDRATPAWGPIPAASPGCAANYPSDYTSDSAVIAQLNGGAQVALSPGLDGRATYTIKLPAGLTIVAGWGTCGRRCVPAIAVGRNSYDFHC